MSGTSMATPHVAGAAAILAQQHTDWPGGRLKSALMASAAPATEVYAQGAGRVDVAKAITQQVTAEPANIHFGEQLWPHTDDEPVTREVVYRNAGAEPVTLDLATDEPTFTVRPASVTVPAGGAATVTVTADTRVPGPDGSVTGTLTAGGVRTLLSVRKEVESYDVTIERIGRDGDPAGISPVDLYNLDSPGSYFLFTEKTVRLPKGRYNLAAFFLDPQGAMTLMVRPVLDVSSALTMTVDARLAKPSRMTVSDPSASLTYVHIGYTTSLGGETVSLGQVGSSFDGLYTGQLGPAAPGFTSNISAQWVHGMDIYQIAHHQPGRLISGYERTVSRADLATLRMRTSGGDHEAVRGGMFAVSRVPGQPGQSLLSRVFAPLPATFTWYVNTDGGVEWRAGLYQSWEDPSNGDQFVYAPTWGPWTRYQARRTYEQVWNQAVIAPVLPGPDDRRAGVTRTGDRITVDLSPYGDGAGRVGTERDGGTTVLFRDGVQTGQSDVAGAAEFVVPAGESAYRLEMHAVRGAPYELSTKIDTAWTFRSAHGAAVLPLWTVRLSPRLDERNTAPAGCAFTIPVEAKAAPGAATGRLKALSVEVSYDDGKTWVAAPVVKGAATVRHPRGQGFVSLRTTASDTAGNTVTQTVLHAYRYSAVGTGR
jgi:hypothetical protein